MIETSQIERDCSCVNDGLNLGEASFSVSSHGVLSGIKHLNRLENVMAAIEAQEQGVDELVLCDQSGNLVSLGSANLFLVKDKMILTPKIAGSVIAGTRRALIIERLAPALDLAVKETHLSLNDLEQADEVFCSNALQGIRPVISFKNFRWNTHPVCHALFDLYRATLA